jgi:hypothetical protein
MNGSVEAKNIYESPPTPAGGLYIHRQEIERSVIIIGTGRETF